MNYLFIIIYNLLFIIIIYCELFVFPNSGIKASISERCIRDKEYNVNYVRFAIFRLPSINLLKRNHVT